MTDSQRLRKIPKDHVGQVRKTMVSPILCG